MYVLHSLNSQLLELKTALDKAIMEGNSHAEVKKIYKQIQEVKRRIVEQQVELLKKESE